MTELVETWKRAARARIVRERAQAGAPRVTVSVTRGFALLCALAGLRYGIMGPPLTLPGLMSVVLAHELARALVARLVGRSSSVTISAVGGQTEIGGPALRGRAAVAFEFAGPLANFAAAISVFALLRSAGAGPLVPWLPVLASSHAAWGAAQVLPVLPFRTGRAIARGLRTSQQVLYAAASWAAIIAVSVVAGSRAPAFMPLLTLSGFACASALGRLLPEWWDARSGGTCLAMQAEAKLRAGDAADAALLAERGLAAARATRTRKKLWITLAWGAIGIRDPLLAHHAMCHLSQNEIDFYLVAAYLSCCNRTTEAEALLLEARRLGHRDRETTKLLLDVYFRRGKADAMLELARAEGDLLGADDWRMIEAAIPDARQS